MAAYAGPAPGVRPRAANRAAVERRAGRVGSFRKLTQVACLWHAHVRILAIAVLVNGLRDRRIGVVQWASSCLSATRFSVKNDQVLSEYPMRSLETEIWGQEDDMSETVATEGVAEPQRPDVGALLERPLRSPEGTASRLGPSRSAMSRVDTSRFAHQRVACWVAVR